MSIRLKNLWSIVISGAVVLGLAIWAKSWMVGLPQPLAEDFTTAEVISVERKSMESRSKYGIETSTHYAHVKLALDDGRSFETTVFQPHPQPGTRLSIKVTEFDDGTKTASVIP